MDFTTSLIINSILHIFGVVLLLYEIKNVGEALKKETKVKNKHVFHY